MSYIRHVQRTKKIESSKSQLQLIATLPLRKKISSLLYSNKSVFHETSIQKYRPDCNTNLKTKLSSVSKTRSSISQNHRKYSKIIKQNNQQNEPSENLKKKSEQEQGVQQIYSLINKRVQNMKSSIRQNLRAQRKQTDSKVTIYSFFLLFPIGKGSFGKVWKGLHKRDNNYYAIKEMKKQKIIQKNCVKSILNQKKILQSLENPFIITLHWSFQTQENVYLVLDYLDGGDLKYHIKRRKKFQENQAKFIIANIILGLSYLREKKIIHRDLKPENIVFGGDGYLKITDLGLSRQYQSENYLQTSGTPGYMAPEVIKQKNHSYSADYYGLGVIAYELMLNRRPFYGRTIQEVRENMQNSHIFLTRKDIPYKWSQNAADFINRMLESDPKKRLGHFSMQDIYSHPWFSDISWDKIVSKQQQAPFIPKSIEQNYRLYKQQIPQDSLPQHDKMQNNYIDKKQLFATYNYTKTNNIQEPAHRLSTKKAKQNYQIITLF